MFIDRVKLNLKAGKGGNGIVSFRREKYVPFGGPSGGDGGDGGNIVFVADSHKSTLLDLRYNKIIKAQPGENGKTKKMHGARAADVIIKVPVGTLVKRIDTDVIVADLTSVGQEAIIAKGGRGGRGNYRFMSSRNTAPDFAELGEPGDDVDVLVELRLLADVGLVGFPSVGKSTLLSVVSKARPEIAAYHFTTIIPNLGVVEVGDGRSFVMADLPGLIEGASQGKGLGLQFLRHIERCRVIVHVLDMGSEENRDPLEDYEVINQELEQYDYDLLRRPQIVVANKMDLDTAEENLARFKEKYPEIPIFPTTTIIHEGIQPLLYAIADLLAVTEEFPLKEMVERQGVVYKFVEEEPDFEIKNLGNGRFQVTGNKMFRLVSMTDFANESGLMRFSRQLRTMGLDDALRQAGAQDGDMIQLFDYEFEFVE